MSAPSSTEHHGPPPPRRGVRRVALGLVLATVLAAAALALAPSLLAPTLARRLSSATGADVRIGWISWNPLAGRVDLHAVALAPAPDAPAVATLQTLTVDVALWRWLHGEHALDALVLRRPWLALRRTGPGDFDLAALFPGRGAEAAAPAPSNAVMGPPMPLRIDRFRITNGSIEFHDETVAPALETSLYLDDATARDLALASDGTAGLALHVESRLENAPLTLDFSYETAADASHVRATLVTKNASLARALLYVPLGWQRTEGTMDATITYERRVEKNVLRTHGLAAGLLLHDLALTEPWASEPMLRARRVVAPRVVVDLLKQRTNLGAIQVDDYQAIVLRDRERLHVPLASGEPAARTSTWRTALDRVTLGRGTAILRNVMATPELTVPLSSGDIGLLPDATTFGFVGTVAGGRFELDGRTRGDATTLTFGLHTLDLSAAAPLAGLPVSFAKGRVDGTLTLALDPTRATLAGTLATSDASTAPSAAHPEEVVAWQRLELTLAESALNPLRVHVTDATATWPYVMLHRRADGIFPLTVTTTTGRPPTPTGTTSTAPASAEPWLTLDRLAVHGGRIEFYDSTLPKPYGIELTDLAASATAVTMAPVRAEDLQLKGAFDELSPVAVSGRVDAAGGSTLDVTIDRLLLPPLNPYIAPALGYEVKTGLARIGSRVHLDGTKVAADTDLALSRFAMRSAGTNTVEEDIGTPLSVALALMKDTHGDIHLDLPIEGDVGSSEYRVGSLFRKALGTALLGTLRAPLGFLRGIFHKDEGEHFDLRPVPFAAGSATLGAEGETRVAELARLLDRQTALRAVLIPAPSRADFEHVRDAGAPRPLDVLADLARERGGLVRDSLTHDHGIDAQRVAVQPWQPSEPDIEGDPGVDVQLRAE